jgi:hypothetical protein
MNLQKLLTSVRRRAESGVEMQGNQVEHLLWKTQEHRPCLSRHISILGKQYNYGFRMIVRIHYDYSPKQY